MSTGVHPKQKSRLVPIAITVAVLAVVAFGATWAVRAYNAPTAASKADCLLAQQMIDRAQNIPADAAGALKFETDLRAERYKKFQDDGVSTQVGKYVAWQVGPFTKDREGPKPGQFDTMKDELNGHCDGSGVELKIPALKS